ncbi:putative F-box protein At1g67623 [Juglans microcarpa x Juglans regia]|uniref:putative F-box protein At1g67623 n=1 Tax=Juglans microcarpa x Juglans regia TaxID=2249226 RepID=UPI001B7DBE6C|nr:putative F-box protein At1g67623 [Juglans microcarpa x Juglans regia]
MDLLMKAKKTTDHHQCKLLRGSTSIKSLPDELLTEVLAEVGSASFTDLYNAKLSCKDFLKLSEEDQIFQRVSLDKFSAIPCSANPKILSFLERCKECRNPESLYRQGMLDYFQQGMTESGLEYLKRAAEKGHMEATYVYSIILLCLGDDGDRESKLQGMKILSSLKAKSGRQRMKECRKRTKSMMWICMWSPKKNIMVRRQQSCLSKEPCKIQKITNGWLSTDEEVDEYDDVLCEGCRCNREITWFCNGQFGTEYYSF